MAGKSAPALFELIREQTVMHPKGLGNGPAEVPPNASRSGYERPAPPPILDSPVAAPSYRPVKVIQVAERHDVLEDMTEIKPMPAASDGPIDPPARGWRWGQPLVVTPSAMLIAGAVGVALLVGAFALGFRSGFIKGDDRATRELSLAAATPADPLLAEGVRPHQAAPQPAPVIQQTPRPQTPAPGPSVTQTQQAPSMPVPEVVSGPRAVLTPPEPDPRQPGLNYYAIVGQLDRDSAQQIAAYLADNGVGAVAVDTAARGTNNPRSYRVYGLQGMTGAELRSPARAEYEQRISQLGVIWKRDHRGWTDFSQTNWERYQP